MRWRHGGEVFPNPVLVAASASDPEHSEEWTCFDAVAVAGAKVALEVVAHTRMVPEEYESNVSVLLGAGASLECAYEAAPALLALAEVAWTKDGAAVAAGKATTLELEAAAEADAGEYRCTVTTPRDHASR